MRPLSISLEGFFAYRRPTEIDLESADYFSLSGPTGSGKSSLIDAMIFALYGRVPRLGGRDVAPAISAGSDRARVSLRFLVDDRIYTATRLVQRTKSGGATTKEARLESDGHEPVSGAADVTARVAELLRLDFDDFTKTVVLPQGEFARFLQASPGDRQEILRNLLGLGVYRRMGELARQRSQQATSEAESAEKVLDGLGVPDPEAVEDAIERRDTIESLSHAVKSKSDELESAAATLDGVSKELEAAEDAVLRLGGMKAPDHLGETADLIREAELAVDRRREAIDVVDARVSQAAERIAELPDEGTISRSLNLHERLTDLDASLDASDLEEKRTALDTAEAVLAGATQELMMAKSKLDDLRRAHAAHELAKGLTPGDACPVCARTIDQTLTVRSAPDLDAMDEEVATARAKVDSASDEVSRLGREVSADEAVRDQLLVKRAEIVADLGSDPMSPEKLVEISEERKSIETEITATKSELDELRQALKKDESRLADLAESQRSLTTLLIAERDKVSDLRPDLPMSEDPEIGWKELLTWRDRTVVRTKQVASDLLVRQTTLAEAVEATKTEIESLLREHEIEPEWPAAVAVARAHEQATNLVQSHLDLQEKAAGLREQARVARETADVAAGLANHLKASGFERWLMLGAVSQLVDRANSVLDELSGSVYSLHADPDGSFDIIDHRNADEVRPISTLSGGETFMVSLALALALAETLSSGGAGRLESIILDEGFGTLDSESIDVVAGVLEGLSATGLMVGIITHVSDLAERAPVRFEVRKGPDGSTIQGPAS